MRDRTPRDRNRDLLASFSPTQNLTNVVSQFFLGNNRHIGKVAVLHLRWESQSRQHEGQPTVQRYINHRAQGTNILLFVRERKQGPLGTVPYTFLGPATYVAHQGERPVAFTWRLTTPMPEELFEVARSVAAA